jgi:hypothetical protein
MHVKVDPRWNEKVMAKTASNQMVKELKKALKDRAKPSA